MDLDADATHKTFQLPTLPRRIVAYAWKVGGRHQIWVSLLAVAVFLLTAGPLELQRRIVDSALKSGALPTVVMLCGAYAALAVVSGLIKLAFNVYRSWIGESAVRSLRLTMREFIERFRRAHEGDVKRQGVLISIVLSEAEPVGSFVGMCFSEPLMQAGTLLTVFFYLLYLQPWMALFALLLFSLQVTFVPVMQRRINDYAARRIRTLRAVSGEMIDNWANGEATGGGSAQSETGRPLPGFVRRVSQAFRYNMRIYWLKFIMNFLMNLVYHLGIAGVMLVGGWYVLRGELDVGTVVAFVSGLHNVNEPWGDIVNYFRELTAAQVKYNLITGAFAAQRETDETAAAADD